MLFVCELSHQVGLPGLEERVMFRKITKWKSVRSFVERTYKIAAVVLFLAGAGCSTAEKNSSEDVFRILLLSQWARTTELPSCPEGRLKPGHCKVTLFYDSFGDGNPIGRKYNIFIPSSYSGDSPIPLLFVIHGFGPSGSSLEDFESKTGMNLVAEAHHFAVVYPRGLGDGSWYGLDSWISWNVIHGFGYAWKRGLDDTGLMVAIANDISSRMNIDPNRIYAHGHSNGGMLTYLLGCERSDVFAAVAPMAGVNPISNPAWHPGACQLNRGVAINVWYGVSDGGREPGSSEGNGLCSSGVGDFCDNSWSGGFQGDLEDMKERNHCSGPLETEQIGTDPVNRCYTYKNCSDQVQVRYCDLNSGHNDMWSRAREGGFDLSEQVWMFLSGFTRDGG